MNPLQRAPESAIDSNDKSGLSIESIGASVTNDSNSEDTYSSLGDSNGVNSEDDSCFGACKGVLGEDNSSLGASNGINSEDDSCLGACKGVLGEDNSSLGASNGVNGEDDSCLDACNGVLVEDNSSLGVSNGINSEEDSCLGASKSNSEDNSLSASIGVNSEDDSCHGATKRNSENKSCLSASNGVLGEDDSPLGASNGVLGEDDSSLGSCNGVLGEDNSSLGTSNGINSEADSCLGTTKSNSEDNSSLSASNGVNGEDDSCLSASKSNSEVKSFLSVSNGVLGEDDSSLSLGACNGVLAEDDSCLRASKSNSEVKSSLSASNGGNGEDDSCLGATKSNSEDNSSLSASHGVNGEDDSSLGACNGVLGEDNSCLGDSIEVNSEDNSSLGASNGVNGEKDSYLVDSNITISEDSSSLGASNGFNSEDNSSSDASNGVISEDNSSSDASNGVISEDNSSSDASNGVKNKDNSSSDASNGVNSEDNSSSDASNGVNSEDNSSSDASNGVISEDNSTSDASNGVNSEDNSPSDASVNISSPRTPRLRPKLDMTNTLRRKPTCTDLTDLPESVTQQPKETDGEEINKKMNEIKRMNGILDINSKRYQSDMKDLERLGELGSGSYGCVSKMLHKPSQTVIAVKQMRRSWLVDENKRILMDLEVARKSNCSECIVRCFGCFITDLEVWICMEVMTTCFEQLLKRLHVAVPEPVCGKVTVSTLRALHYLKEKYEIIHRDVKPSNILLDERGNIKLCDFGISGWLVQSMAYTRNVGCTPYLAPERIQPPNPQKPHYDIRADVWSLGITLLELAMGEFPYKDCNNVIDVIFKIINQDPPRLPNDLNRFSPNFQHFVATCLTKDYQIRPKYPQLLEHPFFLRYENDNVDVANWYRQVIETNGLSSPVCPISDSPSYTNSSQHMLPINTSFPPNLQSYPSNTHEFPSEYVSSEQSTTASNNAMKNRLSDFLLSFLGLREKIQTSVFHVPMPETELPEGEYKTTEKEEQEEEEEKEKEEL